MKRIIAPFIVVFVLTASLLRAATPDDSRVRDFEKQLDLSQLRTIAVMDLQTLKTLDSFSRQRLERICGSSTFEGHDPVFTVLDIINNPEPYKTANLIKIRSVPLRADFRDLAFLPAAEKQRIIKDGTVSLELMDDDRVRRMLGKVAANDSRKGEAVNQVFEAYQQLNALYSSMNQGNDFSFPGLIVPPAKGTTDPTWHHLLELEGNDPEVVATIRAQHGTVPKPLAGYISEQVSPALKAQEEFFQAWRARDAAKVNTAAGQIADILVKINPAVYPSELTRHIEVFYNRVAKLTLPGAALYFFAFVCFLMSTRVGLNNLRLWGLRLLVLGFVIHTTGIAIRWWLTGSWLPPIKNEFESVMFSAWFGVLIGMLHEMGFFPALWRSLRGIFYGPAPDGAAVANSGPAGYGILGAAASFVGMLSLLAIFTVPYVFHISIGENVGQVNGVLMSYWLYVHVMMVTASYSMIGMAFLLSSWWLIKYYLDYGTLSRVSSRQLEGGGHGFEPVFPAGGGTGAGGAVSFGLSATLARIFFFPVAEAQTAKPAKKIRIADKALPAPSVIFLATLDSCNLVVLQLAFWTLGVGIVLGAIWADQSWGRFWAWDPKETFALVTWIAYLIIVHVRVATQDKAWWTSVLSILGFFLMLFNWIGVNYFLPGLHSYAG